MDIIFFQEHNINLNLQEIAVGLKNEIIDLNTANELVNKALIQDPNDSQLLELSLEILLNNFSSERYNEFYIESDSILNKWRYLLLLWTFNNRSGDSSDYEKINLIYANFDYPSDMSKLVNYNQIDSQEESIGGYKYILDNWTKYLKEFDYLIQN